MKVKEWCIALDNVSPYIDPILGLRSKFLKGERATKEKVFSMIPGMTEEEYARYFRPATEEEINGEFEWDGEQYVLKSSESMKSIKEKAEAYDIALDKIKRLLGTGSNCSREDLEYVFPELKESEDEKMRKELISLVKETKVTDRYYDLNKILAWLEKQGEKAKYHEICDKCVRQPTCQSDCFLQQGEQNLANSAKISKDEQKPADKVEPKFKVGDEIKTTNGESLTITRIDRWGYWSEDLFICDFDDADKWELVEQKPAWSKEDEKNMETLINVLYAGTDLAYEREINWLKSLKDRVQPQPKQEWGEEDQKIASRIASVLEEAASEHAFMSTKRLISDKEVIEIEGWLKSLRPQSQWKPSDLPHWKKSTLPNDNTTGFNSDFFSYNGYCINYKELFDKLPKED